MKHQTMSSIGLLAVICSTYFLPSCQNKGEAVANQYDYTFSEVSYQSEGASISGGLWLPEKKGPHPAMVIVHGSGRSTKNNASNMAEHFVKMGFAVLSHDKRGVGKSGGEYVQRYNTSVENLNLLAKDVSAGVEYLKSREDIDKRQIGLYGWSQAGWVTPIVASFQKDLAFSILISGPTVTTGEENYYSELTGDGSKSSGLTKEQMSQRLKEKGPYGFDPYPYLKQMSMPALWLLGEEDQSIPIPETAAILDRLIKQDDRDFKYIVFDNANHGLRAHGQLVNGYWKMQKDFLFKKAKVIVP